MTPHEAMTQLASGQAAITEVLKALAANQSQLADQVSRLASHLGDMRDEQLNEGERATIHHVIELLEQVNPEKSSSQLRECRGRLEALVNPWPRVLMDVIARIDTTRPDFVDRRVQHAREQLEAMLNEEEAETLTLLIDKRRQEKEERVRRRKLPPAPVNTG